MDPDSDDFTARLKVAIETADVISVFFVRVGHSLIIDLRSDTESEPVVTVEPMADSPYQRLLSFRTLRPTLSLPEEITLAPWADRVGDFESSGLLETCVHRCGMAGGEALAAAVQRCFRQLKSLEKNALRDMIRGVGMHTLWQRDANGD